MILQTEVEQLNTDRKFYSQKAITIATYFGGPLAAGILIRQNFLNLGKETAAKNSLFIGIVSTILIFVGIFSIPEPIIDKIPNFLIPTIYTGIIYLIVEKYLGDILKSHKENEGEFYSGWKAAGIGAISTFIILIGIFSYAYFSPDNFDTKKYDSGIQEFQRNENEALKLYSILETGDLDESVNYIKESGIPKWQKNILILNEMDSIEGLHQELVNQNRILREYCHLRIESYKLIERIIIEDTDTYNKQLGVINSKIDSLINEL